MVSLDDAVIAKLKKAGQNFEILVDCPKAIAFKEGKDNEIRDILAVQKIFSDSSKGVDASENVMTQVFSSSDPLVVAKEILLKGEIQLTADYRKSLREQKRKQILEMIRREGVDPKTNLPHPLTRIENAFEQAKVNIDEFGDVNKQAKEIVDKLKTILPIKFVIKEVDVIVPPSHAPKSLRIINSFGKKLKEEWLPNGSLHAVVEMGGGLEADFYDELNKACQGNADCKLLKIR
ncbi:ribosome assembly factor SBDS [Nanoarchaeota archaeon]